MKKRKYIRSKWRNWRMIHRHHQLASIQPNTMLYSQRSLNHFLQTYPDFFVKPDNSAGGKNVIRVRKKGMHIYALRKKSHRFRNLKQLDQWIQTFRKRRIWIIQQTVPLLPLNRRPVDIRTIVLFHPRNKRWEVTAIFAKAAKSGLAVTNVKAGGTAFRVDLYLKWAGYKPAARRRLVRRMKQLSVAVARQFNRRYPNRLYALDLGLDRNQKIWLIEVNTQPSIRILNKIDPRMYHRTVRVRRRP